MKGFVLKGKKFAYGNLVIDREEDADACND